MMFCPTIQTIAEGGGGHQQEASGSSAAERVKKKVERFDAPRQRPLVTHRTFRTVGRP